MADLAGRVTELAGATLEPRFIPMDQSDREADREIRRRIPDLTKARAVLGYRPKVKLDDGIRELLSGGDIPASWFEPMRYQITRDTHDGPAIIQAEENDTLQPTCR